MLTFGFGRDSILLVARYSERKSDRELEREGGRLGRKGSTIVWNGRKRLEVRTRKRRSGKQVPEAESRKAGSGRAVGNGSSKEREQKAGSGKRSSKERIGELQNKFEKT